MEQGRVLEKKVSFVAGASRGVNLGVRLGFAQTSAKDALISRSVNKIETAMRGLRDDFYDEIGMAAGVRDFAAVDRALATTRDPRGACRHRAFGRGA